MPRIVALVDGFNLYHSLQENEAYHKFKWLDVDKLLRTYFPIDKVARHKVLIRALESTGIEMVYGKFKERDRHCPKCGQSYRAREEKQTDVSIALTMFRMAYEKKFDEAVLLTGDSDQLPSLKEVHRSFPALRLVVLLPIGREAAELKVEADRYIRIRERVLKMCLFDDPLTLADGVVLKCPPKWK